MYPVIAVLLGDKAVKTRIFQLLLHLFGIGFDGVGSHLHTVEGFSDAIVFGDGVGMRFGKAL